MEQSASRRRNFGLLAMLREVLAPDLWPQWSQLALWHTNVPLRPHAKEAVMESWLKG
jgi:hypothetical protein